MLVICFLHKLSIKKFIKEVKFIVNLTSKHIH